MDENAARLRRWLGIAAALVVIGCAYTLVSSFITYSSTGVLRVDPSSQQAVISVSQPDHEAKSIGTGKAAARLKPGTYQVAAKFNREWALKTVKVSAGQTTSISLKLSNGPLIRSVDDISFLGFSGFSDSGLTEDQQQALKLDFFRFKTSTHTIDIDDKSIAPGARMNRRDPFIANFEVKIDSVPYKGTVNYTGSEDVSLLLYNQDGSLAFNSDLNSKPSTTKIQE